MAMTFKPTLSVFEANEVRAALVSRVAEAKRNVLMKLATEQERLAAGRTVVALELLLRREYGDYDPQETNPPEQASGSLKLRIRGDEVEAREQ